MTIIHHPDDATPMSLAAGSLAEPLAAVVASHAAMCPRCRQEIRHLAGGTGEVPAPFVHLVGENLDEVPQRRLRRGIQHLPLQFSKGTKGDLRLITVAPGMIMPEHGHGGTELTLLLTGAYKDEFGHFATGDLADLDEGAEHQPVSDPDAGRICLIASTERARFKRVLARIVQPFVGF